MPPNSPARRCRPRRAAPTPSRSAATNGDGAAAARDRAPAPPGLPTPTSTATRSPTAAVFLNHRGGMALARGASAMFTAIIDTAGLDDHATAQVLRHTFATRLVRVGTDLVVVADMLGHTSLDQIRRYTPPTTADRCDALKHLPVDR
ncbi:tyrosine-type recombinase/integrase [Micromonospora sp. MS34]|uniref:tyrosine-type recombinase/integrase n=1 Tax=Micromonospora sp. MS34 TaxID=3385971 RepID=UPI0039A3BCE5